MTTVGGTQHYLYVNYGGRFKEESKNRSVSMEFPNKRRLAGFTPAFGDFDNDGYPDMYVTEWILHSLGKVSRLGKSVKILQLVKYPGNL